MSKFKGFSAALLAIVIVAAVAPPATAATKIAEFKFNDNYDNTVNSPITLALTSGTAIFQDVDVNGNIKRALVFDAGTGLTISKIPRAVRSVYTIDILMEFDTVSAYRRILSFGPNTTDKGLYVQDGYIDLYPAKEAAGASMTANTFHLIRLVRTGRGVVRVYVDGTQQVRYRDKKGKYTFKDGLSVLFDDDGVSEESAGTISNVKIHSKALIPN